ncbi:MAG: hypothetical protein IPL70_16075 [Uliginosibacterium sp.]|nr:hypothetical protein [Uliginosibacterium sp.]
MPNLSPALTMLCLDLLMIVYTLWAVSAFRPLGRLGPAIAVGLLGWLGLLHFGLSRQQLFPADISGIGFLLIILPASALWARCCLRSRRSAACWSSWISAS